MKYVFPATIHPEPEAGGFSIWFEGLSGCGAQGEDITEALDSAQDALAGWIYAIQKRGYHVPEPFPIDQIPLEPGEYTTLIMADIDAYRKTVDSYAVKKTLSIPSWLNEKAEAANVNYSKVLQDALVQYLG